MSMAFDRPTKLAVSVDHGRKGYEKLRVAAREAKASVLEEFAQDLALHARTEEQVLYPAAILVGDIVRVRMAQK